MINKILNSKLIIPLAIILLFIISLSTTYIGSADLIDYAGVAKFFAGEYPAKIRTSHTIVYGLIHSPLISLFGSFMALKIANLIWILLIILSIYYLSNRDKRTLLLFLASPVVWYIAPWINPIPLTTLLFLWAFYFISKFDRTEEKIFLIYSGILFGLAWSIWNTVLIMLFFILISFFFNRNVNHVILFLLSVLIGLIPLLIIDYIIFGFPFYSLIKHFVANFIIVVFLGDKNIYGLNTMSNSILHFFSFILMMPLFIYLLFSKDFFKYRKRQVISLISSILFFFLINPEIRYLFLLWPILILYLGKNLNERQFKIQFIIFIILSILVITPYIIQIGYSTNVKEFSTMILNLGDWNITSLSQSQEQLMIKDLEEIIKEYPNEVFVVGNKNEDYALLAMRYWGNDIRELVSIEDYNLVMKNESSIFEKRITSNPKIKNRRKIWIGGGIEKNPNDNTDYEAIELGIGVGEPIDLEGFEVIKKYNVLHLSEKS